MPERLRCSRLADVGLLLAVAYIVLTGLFGMHGLGSHGAESTTGMTSSDMSMPAQTAAASSTSASGYMANRAVGPGSDRVGDQVVAEAFRGGSLMGPMRGACVAILTVLVVLLVGVGTRFCGVAADFVMGLRDRVRARARRRDPPVSLIALSLSRC